MMTNERDDYYEPAICKTKSPNLGLSATNDLLYCEIKPGTILQDGDEVKINTKDGSDEWKPVADCNLGKAWWPRWLNKVRRAT